MMRRGILYLVRSNLAGKHPCEAQTLAPTVILAEKCLAHYCREISRHQGKTNGWSVVIIVSKIGGWSVDGVICARRPVVVEV